MKYIINNIQKNIENVDYMGFVAKNNSLSKINYNLSIESEKLEGVLEIFCNHFKVDINDIKKNGQFFSFSRNEDSGGSYGLTEEDFNYHLEVGNLVYFASYNFLLYKKEDISDVCFNNAKDLIEEGFKYGYGRSKNDFIAEETSKDYYKNG